MRTVLLSCLLGAAAVAATRPHALPAWASAAALAAHFAPADTAAVQGRVLDRTGQGVVGATVLLKGTKLGTSTDANGRFLLRLPQGARKGTLVVNMIGYEPREVAVRRGQQLDIRLAESTQELKEVVIGYGTGKSKPLAGKVAGVRSAPARSRVKGERSRTADAQLSGIDDVMGNSMAEGIAPSVYYQAPPAPETRESYAHQAENGFQLVHKAPLSTFSIDVDAASYANVRRYLSEHAQLPPPDAVRTEELVNYFRYDYPQPADAPAGLHLEQARCPWAPAHQLVLIGLQARTVPVEKLPPANLTFLIDVSGSMQSEDKLPLVKAGLRQLVQQLRPQDQVALVVYAGAAGLVLPPTPGTRKSDIVAALDRLEAGGSTAGGAGLKLAYATARQHFNKEGNNRVILCSDGDFNVGESSDDAMEHLITQERESGVFLSVLGFGTGNLQDSKMERLADKGNGNYAYIDQLGEARRVLVQQFGGTLFTLAKDVKLQVEFNPAKVQAYRLIGYENRLLADEDFNNDRKDAGELGAGQQVTALYEVVPVGAPPVVDGLKYQPTTQATTGASASELLTVKMRYKQPQGLTSSLLSRALPAAAPADLARASDNLRWAAAVAQMSLLLRQSERRGAATWQSTVALARTARSKDDEGYRAECIRLMETAASLTPQPLTAGKR